MFRLLSAIKIYNVLILLYFQTLTFTFTEVTVTAMQNHDEETPYMPNGRRS